MASRRSRRISSSDFPANMHPLTTSSEPFFTTLHPRLVSDSNCDLLVDRVAGPGGLRRRHVLAGDDAPVDPLDLGEERVERSLVARLEALEQHPVLRSELGVDPG